MIINVEQQSEQWHEIRQRSIGSSDAPIILWMDPWGTTPYQLWKEKTSGKRRSDWKGSESKQHGKDNEAQARDQAAASLGDFFAPVVVQCEAEGLAFMIASLDGANEDLSEIMEVKCPQEIGTHLQAREGNLDDHYYAQVQHQLFCSGARVCHFFSWFRGELAQVDMTPDQEFQIGLIQKEQQFWGWVETGKYPMPDGEATVDTKDAIAWAELYADNLGKQRALEDQMRKIKARLLSLRPDAKLVKVGPLEINWTYRKAYTEKKPREVGDSLSCTIRRVR